LNILREERDYGRTVIVISHDERLNVVADHIFDL
jgi:excinuclease UvrABC ATPase subunit